MGVLFTNPLRVVFYGIFFLACCVLFSWLWVEISGSLNAKEVSKQLYNSGIQIPGFRSSKRQLYMIMKKYIPALTILGGLFVGILAFIADLTGALGGGTYHTVNLLSLLKTELMVNTLQNMQKA